MSYKLYSLNICVCLIFIILIYNEGLAMKEYNRISYDNISNKEILIGETTLEAFSKAPFKEWFDLEYNYYNPNKELIIQLKGKIGLLKILIFLGTWCPDSRIDVPRFIKILDQIDFNKNNLKIIAVDRQKNDPNDLSKIYNIEYVPTFIFLKENIEIGRIIESPKNSLEADMLEILSK